MKVSSTIVLKERQSNETKIEVNSYRSSGIGDEWHYHLDITVPDGAGKEAHVSLALNSVELEALRRLLA
ncbi:MAG: hypothetical protein K2Y32_00230 [Candidatus Obscuribacterales bacterium]|nr:hypothetical protein [Candidatus Obscuribacterales bacterium]